MSLLPSLNESIKKIAINAINETKPASIIFGTVTSPSPLKISVEQKLTLDSNFLILTDSVKDHEVDMTVDGVRKKYMVHKSLKTGEKVILLRQQGGQKYIVLDREV